MTDRAAGWPRGSVRARLGPPRRMVLELPRRLCTDRAWPSGGEPVDPEAAEMGRAGELRCPVEEVGAVDADPPWAVGDGDGQPEAHDRVGGEAAAL